MRDMTMHQSFVIPTRSRGFCSRFCGTKARYKNAQGDVITLLLFLEPHIVDPQTGKEAIYRQQFWKHSIYAECTFLAT